jgi:hypothetical protein
MGTISYHLRNAFPGASGDRKPGSGDGCWMWFQQLSCQLVGVGMVPGYVMKRKWVHRVMPRGFRPHVNALPLLHHHFRAAPEAAVFVVCKIHVVLQTVSLSWKTQIKGRALKWPGRATAGGQRGCCAPVFGRGLAKWKCLSQFDMSHFGVLLAGIDLYNVYECVPVVKTRPGVQDPMDQYAVKLFA